MYTLIKYLFDKVFALSLLIILLPFLALIFFILTIHHSGSPIFMQTRVGLNEKFFKIIKFRTMNTKRDKNGILLDDSLRIFCSCWSKNWEIFYQIEIFNR